MGNSPRKTTTLIGLILGEREDGIHWVANYDNELMTCPVCENITHRYHSWPYYMKNHIGCGVIAYTCPDCSRWFESQVDTARKLLYIYKLMLVCSIFCRDVAHVIMRLHVMLCDDQPAYLDVLRFMQAGP
jgi:hypothetical protein